MEITNASINLDNPADGRRVATAEIEIDNTITIRGFGVFPDGSGLGLRVYPPSSGRRENNSRVSFFETSDNDLGREVNRKILELVDIELKKGKNG